MYAVIRAGGKQYRVAPGDVIKIEKLALAQGEHIQFNEVLAVSPSEGELSKPEGATVTAANSWSRAAPTRYWSSTTSARSSTRS